MDDNPRILTTSEPESLILGKADEHTIAVQNLGPNACSIGFRAACREAGILRYALNLLTWIEQPRRFGAAMTTADTGFSNSIIASDTDEPPTHEEVRVKFSYRPDDGSPERTQRRDFKFRIGRPDTET